MNQPQKSEFIAGFGQMDPCSTSFHQVFFGQACFTLESLDNDSLESKFHKQLIFKLKIIKAHIAHSTFFFLHQAGSEHSFSV